MNPHLNEDAEDFAAVAGTAFADAGGVDLARRAEADPTVRADTVEPLLRQLGLDDLDPVGDADSAEAGAALCREAGRVVLPYPVVPALLGRLALDSRDAHGPRPGSSNPRVDHVDAFDEWRVATIHGAAISAAPAGAPHSTRLGPFAGEVTETGTADATALEIALHLTLTGFVVAGALAHAVELATAHVVDRVQFDRPLSKFQAVQFQLADAHTEVAGVEEVVQFALWRCHEAPDAALADALSARLAAADGARSVLRITQQLHGAAGVCDEYDVSVIARHLQPALRLPFGAETTAAHLADAIARDGFVGLFPHGPDATDRSTTTASTT
ncbi:MAG: acyl-CoA dehydrogenase family protein [Acidimicrobiales bacterium]|nr:acyl-CoA dehydrogenase family protein [Acidimicrobiales bacterium]